MPNQEGREPRTLIRVYMTSGLRHQPNSCYEVYFVKGLSIKDGASHSLSECAFYFLACCVGNLNVYLPNVNDQPMDKSVFRPF